MNHKPVKGFDAVAPLYDVLAGIFFGHTIRKAQSSFLDRIPAGSKVLILGGGTGRVLTELLRVRPECKVWYVEASQKMISRARSRMEDDRIVFVLGTQDDIPAAEYDGVLTHFFLDLFSPTVLPAVIEKVLRHCKSNTWWIAADFVETGKRRHALLLRVMYTFFRTACGIDARRLPPWRESLAHFGFSNLETQRFYGGFIESCVFKRTVSQPLRER